jgi:hypothetical protein
MFPPLQALLLGQHPPSLDLMEGLGQLNDGIATATNTKVGSTAASGGDHHAMDIQDR